MKFKNYFSALMLLALLCLPWLGRAQFLADYTTSTGIDAQRWIDISSTTSIIGSGDGSASTLQEIGFAFPMAEGSYSQFSVNSDGNLRLGSTVTSTSYYNNPFSSSYANQNNPKINGFGNDGYSVANKHYVRTELQGSAPDRVRIVEFCLGTYSNTTRDSLYRYQVQLHENGDFCIVYKSAARAPQVARQTGACFNGSDIVLFNSGNVFSVLSAGNTTATWSSGQWPEEGRYYNYQRPVLSCPSVVNITRLPGWNSVDLSWTEQGSASQWIVNLLQGGNLVSTTIATSTSTTLTGLLPQTSYEVQVRALCGAGDTSMSRGISFTTSCAPLAHSELPLTDDFESYTASSSATLSPCYYKYYNGSHTTTNYPYPSSTTALSGTKSLYFYSSSSAGYYSYLVLPQMEDTLSSLECVINLRKSSSSYAGRFQVGVIVDPEDFSTFTPINDITLSEINTWKEYTTYFGSYWGEGKHICLVAPQTTSTNYIYLDDVVVRPITGCPAVSNLQVELADGQATCSWHENGSAQSWMLFLAHRGDSINDPNTLYAVSTDTSYTFSGIANNSPYTLYVVADCQDATADTIALDFFSFCSLIGYDDLPYADNFESYTSGSSNPINPCWTKHTSGTTAYPYPYTSAAIEGNIGLRFYSYHPSSATATMTWCYAALPAVEPTTDIHDLAVFFDQKRYTSTTSSYVSMIVVGMMSDPTDISTFDTVQVFDLTALPASTVVHQVCSFATYNGQGRHIAFYAPVPVIPEVANYAYNYCDIDNVVVNNAPICSRPDSLQASVVTPNSLVLTWQADSEITSFLVETDSNAFVVNGNSATLNNLTPATLYTISVRSLCWTGDTSDAVFLTVRTACGDVTLPYVEGFENYTTSTAGATGMQVPCWAFDMTGTSAYQDPMYLPQVYYSSTYAASGNYSLRLYGDGYHTLPEMPLPLNQLMLSFSNYTASSDYHLELYSVEDSGFAFICDVTNSTTGHEDHLLYLNQHYSGSSHQLAFRNRNASATTVVYYGYHYIDDILIDLLPSCFPVDSLHMTDIAASSASVAWNGTAAMHQVRVENQNGVVSDIVTTDTYADLTGLTPQTNYTVYVRAICADDDTSLWRSISFATTCVPAMVPWLENFDNMTSSTTAATGYQPDCWLWNMTGSASYQTASYQPQVYYSSTYAHSGSYSLRLSGESTTCLPVFDVEADSLMIDFWARHTQQSYSLQVGVMEGTNFIPVRDIQFASTTASEHFSVYLFGYSGTSHTIAFRNYNNDGASSYSYIYLDDISVNLLPSCYPVDSLRVDNVTPSSVELLWNGNASSYEIEYGPVGFAQGQGTTLTSTSSSILLGALSGNTNYDVYVRGICSTTDQSDWSMLSFWTGCDIITTFPWTENFDNMTTSTSAATGVQPNCWNWIMTDVYNAASYQPMVYRSATYATSGMYSLRLYGNSIVMLPEFGPTVDSLVISFDARTSSVDYLLQVGAMEGDVFVPIQNVNYSSINATNHFELYLDNYNGNSHILALRNYNTDVDVPYSYHYIDGISVDLIPSCLPVSDLHVSDASIMSIELDWSDRGNPISWQIEYGPAGFAQGQGTMVDVTARPATISGLEASTPYSFYVRPLCSADDFGPWSPMLTATTLCTTVNAPYQENFDYTPAVTYNALGELPGCWDAYTNGASAAYMPHVVGSGSYWYADNAHSLVMTSGSGADYGNTKLVRLPLFTQPVNTLSLNFWMATEDINGILSVGYFTSATTDPASFVSVRDINASSLTRANGTGANVTGYRDTVDFANAPANAVAIGFRWNYSATYYSCCIDDVEVISTSNCTLPEITIDTVSHSVATISWDGPSDNYEVGISENGSDAWTDQAVTGFTATFTDLAPSTNYQVRVRALCDTNMMSPYAYRSFTTDALPCFAPVNVTAAPNFSSVVVDWTPVTNEHRWQISLTGATTDTIVVADAHPMTIAGLYPGASYQVAVRALCGDNAEVISDSWSDTVIFATFECDAPSNLTASRQDGYQYSVTWTPGDNNNGNWIIEYGPAGFVSGQGVTLAATSNNETLLLTDYAGASVDIYVRALCEEGAPSRWSNKVTVDVPTVGIEQVDNADLSIYPNPASGNTSISLSGLNGDVRLMIVDMNGRPVRTEQMTCDGTCVKVLNVEGLASGAYFVRVMSDNFNTVKKLIVK